MNPLIQFQNVQFKYDTKNPFCMKDLNLSLKQGEFVLLTGQSGSGKTTITRMINGLIPDFYEGIVSGNIITCNQNHRQVSIGDIGQHIASVFQDPRSQFFTTNSSHEVAFALENFGYTREEMLPRVSHAFDALHIPHLKNRPVFDLSSGERQKIAIAAAYALRPEVIVLDEPTANLDLSSILEIHDLLQILKKMGHTIIVSEHRIFWLNDLVDRFILVDGYQIIQDLDLRHTALEKKQFEQLRSFDLNQLRFRPTCRPVKGKENQRKGFHLSNIDFCFDKKSPLLRKVALHGLPGEVVAIVGTNGCGKTTLGKVMAGLLKSKNMSCQLGEEKIPLKHLSDYVYFVMQEADHQLYTDNVLKELCLEHKQDPSAPEKAEKILANLDLSDFKNAHPYALSGGQKQRVSLGAAAMSQKPVLILDEPTSGLDFNNMKKVAALINALCVQGKIIFIISHDIEFLSLCATHYYEIQDRHGSEKYALYDADTFEELKHKMLTKQTRLPKEVPLQKIKPPMIFDPRVILFQIILAGAFAFSLMGPGVGLMLFGAMALTALFCKRVKTVLKFGLIYLGLAVLSLLIPPLTSFLGYFIRFMPMLLGLTVLMETTEVTTFITALQNLKLSQKLILPLAVILRFFPSLVKDIEYIKQSSKTRSVDINLKGFLINPLQTYEFILIPLLMRVLLTANELAASAETRGMTVKLKKSSFEWVKLRFLDFAMMLFIVSMYAFIFIQAN